MASGIGHGGLNVRNRWRAHAWLVPAVLGAAVTALLLWSAWITARSTTWPDLHHTWWWTILAPDQDGTLAVTSALWLASLATYWQPRRLQRQPIALITIASMVLIGGALAAASLVPCRGNASHAVVLGWLLSLYLGNQPATFVQGAACAGYPPLAMQLGEIFCPGATVVGALAVGAVLWREPAARLRSRFASHATVFTGLDALTLPLLRQLTKSARSPRDIIVIERDEDNTLLDEARLTGARVVIGDPSSDRLLEPIICGLRGCALYRLYAVGERPQENEEVVAAAAEILRRYQAEEKLRPNLVALIDDPRHADAWRGSHGSAQGIWFEDALSSVEVTACWVVGQVIRTGARELLLCGDNSLSLAILLELARRAWELTELAEAAAIGAGALRPASPVDDGKPPRPPQQSSARTAPPAMPVKHVVLLDPKSGDMRREYAASVPTVVLESGPTVVAQPANWHDHLLPTLDAKEHAAARRTAVVIVDGPYENGLHQGGRVARLYPDTPVFVLASPGEGISQPIFGQLTPFERGLLVDGKLPEDTWRRIARHWHEYHRLSHPVELGDPKTAYRLPWADLDPSIRLDNILQLRSILTQVTALGRRWAPLRLMSSGSFITLSDSEIEKIAKAEHARWCRRRMAEGWSADTPATDTALDPATTGRTRVTGRIGSMDPKGIMGRKNSTRRANMLLLPWEDLPADERVAEKDRVRAQLKSLEEVGFMPVLPPGGPPGAESFERIGIVIARRLTAPLLWTLSTGDEMRGNAGDWRVVDSTGSIRTVTDPEFRSSHEPLGNGRWRRTGTFKAWQVAEAAVVRTKEGNATARPGDWVVEGSGGERWPVTDEQFQASYRVRLDRPVTAGQASTPAAISSSTAPTISS
jgi:hypothetical protein